MDSLACSPSHGGDFAAFSAVVGAFYGQALPGSVCHPARFPLLPMLEYYPQPLFATIYGTYVTLHRIVSPYPMSCKSTNL